MSSSGSRLALLVAPLALGISLVAVPDAAHARPPAAVRAGECQRTLPAYAELDPGDRAPAVRTLQCAINDLGLGPVVVDGYYGPQTKKALRKVVRGREGQPPHPFRLTPLFWHQLYGLQLPNHTLREGDHGHDVRNLQRALRAFGLELAVDGDFGPQTARVLEDYQAVHHLTRTGRTDRDTRYFLAGGDYW
jgi:peptidoglycan hydrolase-like protein with peptidoglycan-binding domain